MQTHKVENSCDMPQYIQNTETNLRSSILMSRLLSDNKSTHDSSNVIISRTIIIVMRLRPTAWWCISVSDPTRQWKQCDVWKCKTSGPENWTEVGRVGREQRNVARQLMSFELVNRAWVREWPPIRERRRCECRCADGALVSLLAT